MAQLRVKKIYQQAAHVTFSFPYKVKKTLVDCMWCIFVLWLQSPDGKI